MQLIGPGDIIINAWINFRRHLKVYAEFVVWFALLSVMHWALSLVARAAVPDKFLRLLVLGLLTIPLSLAFAALTVAIYDLTAKTLQKKKPALKESVYAGIHNLLPFIWISLLVSLIVGLGFLLFIIPGVIFLMWFKFAANHLVVDDIHGSRALKESRKLVVGRWWAVFVRVLIPGLFFYMAASFARAVAFLLIGAAFGDPALFFGTARLATELPNSHALVMTLVPQVITGFALPLFIASDFILWFDLKKTA